jgi:DNA-binding CsgD family transcriptional regulator
VLAEKARELELLREKRVSLRAEIDALEPQIQALIVELCTEIHESPFHTPREGQVLGLVRAGKSNKEIGAILNISERTVKYHVTSLFQKYRVQDRHKL